MKDSSSAQQSSRPFSSFKKMGLTIDVDEANSDVPVSSEPVTVDYHNHIEDEEEEV